MGRATHRCAGVIQAGAALLRMVRARARGRRARTRESGRMRGGAAEERKRGALAAQVPSPRGMEGRKMVVRSASPLGRDREAEAAEAEE